VHESDVGRALQQCIAGAGPPGAYNIAGDGVLTVADLVRELGGFPVPLPAAVSQLPARAAARLPFLPPVAEWVEAGTRPVIMDTTRARERLGWTPRYSGLEVLRESLSPRPD
jgi:nucleoside-diphosphate-sugar epimerase